MVARRFPCEEAIVMMEKNQEKVEEETVKATAMATTRKNSTDTGNLLTEQHLF